MRNLLGAAAALALVACAGELATLPSPAIAAGKPTAISVTCGSVVEGAPAICTISKSGGNGRALTIAWGTRPGTAVSPTDFVADSAGNRTLGSTPVKVNIATVARSGVNGTRAFQLCARATSGTTGAQGCGTATIIDNDVAPPPPPAPSAELAVGGQARGAMVCQSLANPNDATAEGATYTVVGFAARLTSLDLLGTSAAKDYVILNDATHRGDGYFGIMVPTGCVEAI